jgi:hypothetical protein
MKIPLRWRFATKFYQVSEDFQVLERVELVGERPRTVILRIEGDVDTWITRNYPEGLPRGDFE